MIVGVVTKDGDGVGRARRSCGPVLRDVCASVSTDAPQAEQTDLPSSGLDTAKQIVSAERCDGCTLAMDETFSLEGAFVGVDATRSVDGTASVSIGDLIGKVRDGVNHRHP